MNTYAAFVEDMHRGKVPAKYQATIYPMPKKLRDREWSITNYDFGHLMDESHPDFLGVERIQGAMKGVANVDFDGPMKTLGVTDKSQIMATREPFAIILWIERRRAIITARPSPDPTGKHLDAHWSIDAFLWNAASQRWVADFEDREWAMPIPFICSALLANPDVTQEMADFSVASGVNRRLRLRNKRPVPQSVRIIKLSRVEKIGVVPRSPHQGGTHRSPMPHDRSGYSYVRSNGRVVHVKGPIKVRGGRAMAQAVAYEVRP